MADSYLLSGMAKEQLFQLFREFDARVRNEPGHRATFFNSPMQVKEGILDGALSASTSSGQTETTATLSVWTGVGADWADSTDNITVTNRSDDTSANSGVYLAVYRINGEWRPMWVDC